MQAILMEKATEVKKQATRISPDFVRHYLAELQVADNKKKSEIENMLVNIGSQAVPELVNQLQVVTGSVRGVVAMTLIRIGEDSIAHLQNAARINKDFEWVAKYLINEITMTEIA